LKLLSAIWQERVFIGLLANLVTLLSIADLVRHKDVEVDGGISASEMSELLSKGIDVNLSTIAGEKLTFDADMDAGYSLRIKSNLSPAKLGDFPSSSKPLPDVPINWGYVHPESSQ
jgi:hypothetical protein